MSFLELVDGIRKGYLVCLLVVCLESRGPVFEVGG